MFVFALLPLRMRAAGSILLLVLAPLSCGGSRISSASFDGEQFVWEPSDGFPKARNVYFDSGKYDMKSGGYFSMEYRTEKGYDTNCIVFEFPSWMMMVKGTATVVAQGISKQFPVLCNDGTGQLSLNGATDVSKISVQIDEVVVPELHTTSGEQFVWEPSDGFPRARNVYFDSGKYDMKSGGYFSMEYRTENRHDANRIVFDFPSWMMMVKGTATVVAQGISKQFPVLCNDGTGQLSLNGAKDVSKISVQIEEVVVPELHTTSGELFVWEPSDGFPTARNVYFDSGKYDMKSGGHFSMEYRTENGHDANRIVFDFPSGLKVKGTATVVAQGISKQFPVWGDHGAVVLTLSGVKRVSKLVLAIEEGV